MFNKLLTSMREKRLTLGKTFLILGSIALLYFSWGLIVRSIDARKSLDVQQIVKQEANIVEEKPLEAPKKLEDVYKFLALDFTELLKKNPDVVGWLRINNTTIDYPVVQAINNDFYLNRNLDKVKSSAGWIFADSRNDMITLDFNTIVYGHNRIDNIMFGGLKNLSLDSVNSLPETQYINFTTPKAQMVFQICSVYVTAYDDPLYYGVDISSTADKQNFIDGIQKKNTVPNFAVSDISPSDRFLTLSTCHGGTASKERFVVVARLLADKRPDIL